MLQKEEKIVVVLLVMAALSLVIGYLGFSEETKTYSHDSKIGERVQVEGTVMSRQMTRTGDNLILTISNLEIKVFVPKDNGAKQIYGFLKNGDRVRITGKLSEYKNVREIMVESAGDVVKS